VGFYDGFYDGKAKSVPAEFSDISPAMKSFE
jgi:hypothetical protein